MSEAQLSEPEAAADLLTIDELALAAGLTVRTTRYYASLGLLPPPLRKGRLAYYGADHLARLEFVRALQDHGFTLAAIERYLAEVPLDCTAEELSVQRALLTAWKPSQWEELSHPELEHRVGRTLAESDVDWLVRAGAVRRGAKDAGTEALQVLPIVGLAVQVYDDGMPLQAIVDANAAVREHMSALADELSAILRDQVMSTLNREDLTRAEAERFGRTVANLRSLTLDAIVHSFQASANQLARRQVQASSTASPYSSR